MIMRMLSAIIIAILLSGCAVHTHFSITNMSGRELSFESTHTMDTVKIKNGSIKVLPHSFGNLIACDNYGNTYVYENLTPLEFKGTVYLGHSKYFLSHILSSKLIVGSDLKIYVLPFDCDSECEFMKPLGPQPNGYPVFPKEEGREGAKEKGAHYYYYYFIK